MQCNYLSQIIVCNYLPWPTLGTLYLHTFFLNGKTKPKFNLMVKVHSALNLWPWTFMWKGQNFQKWGCKILSSKSHSGNEGARTRDRRVHSGSEGAKNEQRKQLFYKIHYCWYWCIIRTLFGKYMLCVHQYF